MHYYITVDGGTTNTRLYLVKDGEILSTHAFPFGAGKRDREGWAREVRSGILFLLAKCGIEEGELSRIILSGMITSEYGLCPLPHLTAPVGIEELRKGATEVMLPEISSVPCVFLRGVRVEKAEGEIDMMRGEETELMGVLLHREAAVYALLGTHTKIIETDVDGRITTFSTMLTGELISAVAEHTIVGASLALSSCIEPGALCAGFEACRKNGMGQSLFAVRVMRLQKGASEAHTYSFFLGVMLKDEVLRIESARAERAVVGGQKQLREALGILLERYSQKRVSVLSDEAVSSSAVRGALRVYAQSR